MPEIIQEPIRQATYIAATPERVFDTITSATGWDAFFTTGMTLDPKPGGTIVFRWKDWGPDCYSVEADGAVVEVVRPSRFVFQWGTKMRTTIEIDLTAERRGTVVRLKEYGYPDTHEGRAMMLECASGWGEALTLLKFYLEFGVKYTRPQK